MVWSYRSRNQQCWILHGSMSQYLTYCSSTPDTSVNAMASTQKEESAIVAQACLCSGQNATRIFTSVLRVVTAASEVIWSNWIKLLETTGSQEQEFYPNSRRWNMMWVGWKAWSGHFFKGYHHSQVCNTKFCVHLARSHFVGWSHIWIVWESPSPLVATLDTQTLENFPRRLRHTLASGAMTNAWGEYAHVDSNLSDTFFPSKTGTGTYLHNLL